LFLVDAAPSDGVIEVDADGWGADVVFSGSHKGLAAPVGLAFLAISDRVWEIAEKRKDTIRSHYSSLITWKNEFIAPPPGKIWFSFPVPLVHAVRARLDKIFREGPENVFKRHHIAATAIRRGIKEMGIGLFTDEKYSADTHCCFVNPSGVERAKVVSTMMNRYGMVIGAPPYRPELFYVGTINDNQIRPRNIMALLTCLGLTMKHLGVQVETEKAVMAADQVLQQLGGVISRS
jgi:alanine-glyoxylate transaminase/serine-glyoxylate transaminase/serine-pyruvate transaminase